MTRWSQGRSTVDARIDSRELERLPASRQAAEAGPARARTHAGSAVQLSDTDPEGAYTSAYDAGRRAPAALLQNEGSRATSRGGHTVVYEAVRVQLDPPLSSVLRPFNRRCARRNAIAYRSSEGPATTPEEAPADLAKVGARIELAEKAIPHMSPY